MPALFQGEPENFKIAKAGVVRRQVIRQGPPQASPASAPSQAAAPPATSRAAATAKTGGASPLEHAPDASNAAVNQGRRPTSAPSNPQRHPAPEAASAAKRNDGAPTTAVRSLATVLKDVDLNRALANAGAPIPVRMKHDIERIVRRAERTGGADKDVVETLIGNLVTLFSDKMEAQNAQPRASSAAEPVVDLSPLRSQHAALLEALAASGPVIVFPYARIGEKNNEQMKFMVRSGLRLIVGNIPDGMSYQDALELFSPFTCIAIYFRCNPFSGQPVPRHLFADFVDPAETLVAEKRLQGQAVYGCKLQVKIQTRIADADMQG